VLKEHMVTMHKEEVVVKCDICQQEFANTTHLRRHCISAHKFRFYQGSILQNSISAEKFLNNFFILALQLHVKNISQ
jgi:uncharacterized C2H2 Zn-finger protein